MSETGEKYGPEKVTEDLKESLFYPFNLEGEYNAEYVQFLIDLHHELLKRKDYVGLIPAGSQFAGYSNSHSDFDVEIIADDPSFDSYSEADSGFGTASELINVANDVAKKYGQKVLIDQELHVHPLNYFISDFKTKADKGNFSGSLSYLVRPIIGRQEVISSLFEMARNKCQKVSKEKLEKEKKCTVFHCLDSDFGGAVSLIMSQITSNVDKESRNLEWNKPFSKMLRRGFSMEQIKEIFEARKQMWQKRIEDFINQTGPFAPEVSKL